MKNYAKEMLLDVVTHDLKEGKRPIVYPALQPDNPPTGKGSLLGLQFTGVAVFLYDDGTWGIEDSTGG